MTWLTRDTKALFAALAHPQGVSDSALLKRLEVASLAPTTVVKPHVPDVVEPVSATGRLSVRLRSDDMTLLRERAKARDMPTSTMCRSSSARTFGFGRPFRPRNSSLSSAASLRSAPLAGTSTKLLVP
jgi:transposase